MATETIKAEAAEVVRYMDRAVAAANHEHYERGLYWGFAVARKAGWFPRNAAELSMVLSRIGEVR